MFCGSYDETLFTTTFRTLLNVINRARERARARIKNLKSEILFDQA